MSLLVRQKNSSKYTKVQSPLRLQVLLLDSTLIPTKHQSRSLRAWHFAWDSITRSCRTPPNCSGLKTPNGDCYGSRLAIKHHFLDLELAWDQTPDPTGLSRTCKRTGSGSGQPIVGIMFALPMTRRLHALPWSRSVQVNAHNNVRCIYPCLPGWRSNQCQLCWHQDLQAGDTSWLPAEFLPWKMLLGRRILLKSCWINQWCQCLGLSIEFKPNEGLDKMPVKYLLVKIKNIHSLFCL